MKIKGINIGFHASLWEGRIRDAVNDLSSAGFQNTELFGENVVQLSEFEIKMLNLDKMTANVSFSSVFFGGDFGEKHKRHYFAEGTKIICEEALSKLEIPHIIFGGGETKENKPEEIEEMAETINRCAQNAERFKIKVSVQPQQERLIHEKETIDKFVSLIETDLVGLCLDVGHTKMAGIDFKELFLKYKDLVNFIHLTDVDKDGEFCEFGKGEIDFKDVLKFLIDQKYKGTAIICDLDKGNTKNASEYIKGLL